MNGGGLNFGAMLEAARDAQRAEDETPSATKARSLLEIGKIYLDWAERGRSIFVLGDLVTPRGGTRLSAPGTPYIVVECPSKRSAPNWLDEGAGSPMHGNFYDMRVARMIGDTFAPFWVESWEFVPYTGEVD